MRRRKVIAPVLALVIAAGGWFLNITNPKTDIEALKYVDQIPEQITRIQKEGKAPGKYIDGFVIKVTDGDTMEVTYKGETERVRLLCVDTPESVKAGVEVQQYSKEASQFTKQIALNKSVRLVFDKEERDRYGRLLAYVIVRGDSTDKNKEIFLNALLVRNGYARVEIVSPNSLMKDYFYTIQDTAVREKAGMWSLPKNSQPFILSENGQYIPRYKQ
jgi:micrococcal nuclease